MSEPDKRASNGSHDSKPIHLNIQERKAVSDSLSVIISNQVCTALMQFYKIQQQVWWRTCTRMMTIWSPSNLC